MNNNEWLKWRRIGSSDAPIIMMDSPYSTPFQLWERRIIGSEVPLNGAMKRGKEMEPIARCAFEEKMNTIVFAKNIEHPTHYFMTASLDGIDIDEKIMVEIKCPNKEDHEIAKNGRIPQKYYAQCQHQLEVSGLPGMFYFSYSGGEGVIVEVVKDQKYINEMIEKERGFWEGILNFSPPELTEKDYLNQENNPEWLMIAKQLEEIKSEKQKLKELEDKEKELTERLTILSQGKSSVGMGYKFTKFIKRGFIDYQKIPELQNIDKEKYRKEPTTQWRFSC